MNTPPSVSRAPAAEQARHVLHEVRSLAKSHPAVGHYLESAIAGLKRETRRTPRRDRDDVLLALERYSGLTFHEVREETGLRSERVAGILSEFISSGLVECRGTRRGRSGVRADPHLKALLTRLATERGTRADLRGEHLFALTHTPAGCALSLAPRGRSPLADIAEEA
ncbi:MAG TPA: hypothetical protein VIP46_20810 [Pyrinomonadaceae bacterium]